MSWLSSLLSGIGSGAAGALDEADALAAGFGEETFNPDSRSSYNRGMSNRQDAIDRGEDPSRVQSDPGEETDYLTSLLGAPVRAIDRALKLYTGEELISDKPYMHVPGMGREVSPDQPKADSGQAQGPAADLKAKQQAGMTAEEGRTQSALDMLRRASGDNTASFAARGDTVMGADPRKDANMGSFSHSLPTVLKQNQIRVLGQLGVKPDIANMMVSNASSDEARNAIMQLTAKSMIPIQDKIGNVLTSARESAAKAQNPHEVLKYTVAQLRGLGLSDPQIKMLMMSMTPEQGSK